MALDPLTKRLRAVDAARHASVVEEQWSREALRLRIGAGAIVDPFGGIRTTLQQLTRPPLYDAGSAVRRMTAPPTFDYLVKPPAFEPLARPIDYGALTRSPLEMFQRPKIVEVFEAMERRQEKMERSVGPLTFEPEPRPRIAPVRALPSGDEVLTDVRLEVEEYLERRAPIALRRLNGARTAIARRDDESLAQATTSCRRALEAIADEVWPPTEGAVEPNRAGKLLEVGRQQYRNRLVLFFERRVLSKSGRAHDLLMLDLLVQQLRPLIKGASKGVHDDVSLGDAQRIYLSTVNLLAEIARHDA